MVAVFCSQLTFLDEIGRWWYSFDARASTQSFYASQNCAKNAIEDVLDSVNFRLKFLRKCKLFLFDSMKDTEDGINDEIFNNIKNNVDAWILQAEYAIQE